MIDPSWWDLVEERGVDPELVTVEWGYWNGPAECRVTLAERTESWQAAGAYVTPLQRQEIPGMLLRRLTVPLPPPKLGDGYYIEPLLATSEEWCKAFGVIVCDPDGWDRRNFTASWNEQITLDEFQRRLAGSTVDSSQVCRNAGDACAQIRANRMGR